jgi:hypothetical protein
MEPRRQKRSKSFERKANNIQTMSRLCAFKVKAYTLVSGFKQITTAPRIADIKDYIWIHESGVDKICGLGYTGSQYIYFKIHQGGGERETSIKFLMANSVDELISHGMSEKTYKKYLHDTTN